MFGLRGMAGAVIVAAAVSVGGCASGGAAGAVSYVAPAPPENTISGKLQQAESWTLSAFRDLGISVKENEMKDNGKREIEGEASNGDHVKVTLQPQANGKTMILVMSTNNSTQDDKAYSRKVLERILSKKYN